MIGGGRGRGRGRCRYRCGPDAALASRDEQARLAQARRQHRFESARHRPQVDAAFMRGAAPLENVHVQQPVHAERHLHAQRRGRGLVFGRGRPAEEHRPVATLRAHLEPADLLLPGLRQPGHQQAGGVRLDQLLRHPEPLGGCIGLDPHQPPLVDAQVAQPRQVRRLRRPDHDDVLPRRDHLPHRRPEQAPLDDGRLRLQHLRQRMARPPAARQFGIEQTEPGRLHRGDRRTDLVPPPERGANGKVLIVRALETREVIESGLREAGAEVEIAPVYRTLPDLSNVESAKTAIENGEVNWVSFTSSSTVKNFVEALGAEFVRANRDKFRVAVIGPITAKTAREAELTPDVEAATASVEALASALV